MHRIPAISALLLIALPAAAQGPWADAATRATGGAGTALVSTSPFPANPAVLPCGTVGSAGSTRLYGIPELSPVRVGVVSGPGRWRLGLSAAGLFMEGFADSRLALASAAGGLGFRLAWIRRRAGPFPAAHALAFAFGIRRAFSEAFSAAMFAERAVGTGRPSGELPVLALGLAWTRGAVELPVDLRREGSSPPSLHAGLRLRMTGALVVRTGASTGPDRLAAGFGLELGSLGVDLAADRHPELGLSLAVEVRWASG